MQVDWGLVKQALEVAQINESAAEHILLQAVGELEPMDGPLTGGAIPEEKAVVYGRNGYTDEHDPRDLDCRSHAGKDGDRAAIWLQVHVNPESRYRCTRVEAIFDDDSCNVYFFVMNHTGSMVPATGARLGSPYSGSASGFQNNWKAPASPDSIFMGPNSKFWPPALGPLAAFVVDELGNIDSDVVGSIGLPQGDHMSFRVMFTER